MPESTGLGSRLPEAPATRAIFVTSFIVGLSGAVMPGSLLALTVSSVAERGFWAGPLLILGHAIAELLTVIALVKGLGRVLQRPAVLPAIGLVGGLFLVWMGYGLVSSSGNALSLEGNGASVHGIATVLSGFVVTVTNPYWLLWWATIGTTYVAWALKSGSKKGLSLFYTGHELSDVAWYLLVSAAVATGARVINPTVYHWLLIACGLFLLVLAGYFIFSGVRSLIRLRTNHP